MKISILQMHRSHSGASDPAAGLPGRLPPSSYEGTGSVAAMSALRERILARLYLVAALLGLLAYIGGWQYRTLALFSTAQRWDAAWTGLVIFTLVYATMILAGFVPGIRKRLSYRSRAVILLSMLFVAGMQALVVSGLFGSGRIYLVVLPFIASILIGALQGGPGASSVSAARPPPAPSLKGGEVGPVSAASPIILRRYLPLVISIGGMVVVSLAMMSAGPGSGLIPPATRSPGADNNSLLLWVVGLANFTLLAIAGVLSLEELLAGYQSNLERQAHLASTLQQEQGLLEERIQERTENLERRLLQIRTAAEISRVITRELEIQTLLPQVCELVRERFGLYYVGVFLVETTAGVPTNLAFSAPPPLNTALSAGPEGPGAGGSGAPEGTRPKYAVLAAGTGQAGQMMMAEGHRLLIGGDSMIGQAIQDQRPRISLRISEFADVGREPVRFNNPHLPRTRSELALPILSGTEENYAGVEPPHSRTASAPPLPLNPALSAGSEGPGVGGLALGAMTIQSSAEAAFDEDDILVLQGIADSLASAIENARLFSETRANLEEIRKLHRQYIESAWSYVLETHGSLEHTYEKSVGGKDSRSNAAGVPSATHKLQIPLQLREQTIGNLVLERDTPWTEEQRRLADAIVSQATLTLENARLLDESRRRVQQERVAAQLSSKVWASTDVNHILQTTLQELAQALNAQEAEIEFTQEL